jgi:hypothetical protein
MKKVRYEKKLDTKNIRYEKKLCTKKNWTYSVNFFGLPWAASSAALAALVFL